MRIRAVVVVAAVALTAAPAVLLTGGRPAAAATCANVLFLGARGSGEPQTRRAAHNPEVAGSNPAPATTARAPEPDRFGGLSHVWRGDRDQNS